MNSLNPCADNVTAMSD